MYYLLKVKGKAKIPDYVQLRDNSFSLVAYFRLDRPERALEKSGLEAFSEVILKTASEMPFGEVRPIELQ